MNRVMKRSGGVNEKRKLKKSYHSLLTLFSPSELTLLKNLFNNKLGLQITIINLIVDKNQILKLIILISGRC